MKRILIVFLLLVLVAFGSIDNSSTNAGQGKTDGELRNAKLWGEAWFAAKNFATASPMGTSQRSSRNAALAKLKAVKKYTPGFKTDIKRFIDRLKKEGKWDSFDEEVYAHAATDGTTEKEIAAVRDAGGPRAVLEKADQYIDEDMADLRSRLLGTAKTQKTKWAFNLSPVGTAKPAIICSIAAWTAKTLSCWGNDACYDFWARGNNRVCQ